MLYLSQGPHLRHHLVLPMCEPCSQCFLAFHCVLTSFSLISNPPWDIWNHQGVLPLVDFPRLAYRVMTNIFTHSQLQPFSVSLPNIDGLSTWPLSWRTGTKLLRQRNSEKTEAVPVIEEKKTCTVFITCQISKTEGFTLCHLMRTRVTPLLHI